MNDDYLVFTPPVNRENFNNEINFYLDLIISLKPVYNNFSMELFNNNNNKINFSNDSLITNTFKNQQINYEYYWLLLLIIELIAFLGNICLLLVILGDKNLRNNNTTRIVISLSLTDLLLSVFVFPFTMYNQINLSLWGLGFNNCALWLSSDLQLTTTSIFHLCSISYERYLSVSKPMKYRNNMQQRIRCLIIANWLLSLFMITLPFLILALKDSANIFKVNHMFKGKYDCGFFMNSFIVYTTFITFWFPLILMIFFGIKTMCLLKSINNRKRSILNSSTTHEPSTHNQNQSIVIKKNNNGLETSHVNSQLLQEDNIASTQLVNNNKPRSFKSIVELIIRENKRKNELENIDELSSVENFKPVDEISQQRQSLTIYHQKPELTQERPSEKQVQFDLLNNSDAFKSVDTYKVMRQLSNVSYFGKTLFKNLSTTRKELQAQKTLSIILIVFVLSYFPLFLFITIDSLKKSISSETNNEIQSKSIDYVNFSNQGINFTLVNNHRQINNNQTNEFDFVTLIYNLLTWLGYSSAAMNPILHLTLNNNIKTAFKGYFQSKKGIKRQYKP